MEKGKKIVQQKNKVKDSMGFRVFQVINTVIMIFVVFVTLYPFVYLVAQ